MNKNLKLFFKNFSFSNILFKIFIFFSVGFLFRLLINNLFDFTFFIELFSIPLCINLFFLEDSIDTKFFNDNLINFKRPRDRVMNDDYEFKDKLRRKSHWVFLQQFSSDFVDFNDFKERWTPEKKFKNILKDKYYDKKSKVVLFKDTLMWFVNLRKK
uniref:Uncharacterized protein n=1 Tax=Epichloe typhina TaxID=5113 RepID=A0A1J0CZX8_EPITY|nr:hypothetical protein [Epichloe typhina]APB96734.1 hypothetical protein [Epichloe typhina]